MEYQEVVRQRHAVRAFLDRQLCQKDLKDIIEEAQRAPSWMNAQEREAVLATGNTARMIRREYMERAERGMIGISDFTVVHRTEWSEAAQRNMDRFEKDMEEYLGSELDEFVHAQDTLFNAPAFIFLVLPKTHRNGLYLTWEPLKKRSSWERRIGGSARLLPIPL